MNKYICLAIFLLMGTTVFSNDSRMVNGSSITVLDNEDTNVIMQEEEIVITLHSNYYEVDVNFVFYNDGPDENVLMGFPILAHIQNYPGEIESVKLDDFKSYINGNLITKYTIKEETVGEPDEIYIDYYKWFIREVTFPANSRTYSRVTYKASYSYSGFSIYAGYIFGTGKNWKGPIGKITVIINHDDNILIKGGIRLGRDKPFEFLWEADGRYRYTIENIEPLQWESIYINDINPINLYSDHIPFDDRHMGWVWNRELFYNEFSDIKFLTINQLRLFINFYLARYGYAFKNPLYKNFFQYVPFYIDRFNEEINRWEIIRWNYGEDPDFSQGRLNEFEIKNVLYLLDLEKRMPFTSDNDQSIEPYDFEFDYELWLEQSKGFSFEDYLSLVSIKEDQTQKFQASVAGSQTTGQNNSSQLQSASMPQNLYGKKSLKSFFFGIWKIIVFFIVLISSVICFFLIKRKYLS